MKQEKKEHKHNMYKTKIQQDFIIRTKQACDKKMYPKLVFKTT
jgi:hypothetical protein